MSYSLYFCRSLAFFCAVTFWAFQTSGLAAADLRGELRQGTEAFRSGDFEKAVDAFTEAEQMAPENARIVFNRGTALAAAGKWDDAIETFKKTAISKDTAIAVKSLLQLGRITVDRAREKLAPQPEETAAEQRTEIFNHLLAAERYYSEVLGVEPGNRTAQNALEQIRAWRSRMESDWNAVDRAQKRQADFFERLRDIEEWEGKLENTIREIGEEDDSPKKFQAFYNSAGEQQRLVEELAHIRETWGQMQEAQGYVVGQSEDPVGDEIGMIYNLASQTRDALRNFQGKTAQTATEEISRRLNRLRINLAPFEVIVQEAEKKQSMLCDVNPEKYQSSDRSEMQNPDVSSFEPKTTQHSETLRNDLNRQVREQATVAGWMPLMIDRAQHGLEELEQRTLQGSDDDETDPTAAQQTEALRKSMELAVQYGPEIQHLTEDASRQLSGAAADAFPKQEHALKLLRKILEPLKQQQDQQQQQDQNQQNQDQQNQDQQNQDQQNQDQQNQESDQDKQDEDRQKNDEQQDAENKQDRRQEKEMTPREKKEEIEKAERMLRQVKRRQQEANEKRERLRVLLQQAEPVEKDW